MKNDFTKISRIGIDKESNADIFVKIKFIDYELSIVGVVGPNKGGSAEGSCGQIIDCLKNDIIFNTSWNAELLKRFIKVWENYHCNNLQAGSKSQMKWIKEHTKQDSSIDYFTYYSEKLAEAGLNPDPDYFYEGKPYRFGSAWLFKKVPESVIKFLKRLPNADKKPAWI